MIRILMGRSQECGLFVCLLIFSTTGATQDLIPRSQIEDLELQQGAAPSSPPRPLTPLAFGLIMDFEGWRPSPYNDPVGYCTIGYGHLIALKPCDQVDLGQFRRPLSQSDGQNMLEFDTRSARLFVHKLVAKDLTEEQFSALSSFAFNVGKAKFAKSTLLELVNMGEYKLASVEFLRWVKAKGQVFKGLQDRRNCESALFLDQLQGDLQGKFSRGECVSSGVAPPTDRFIDVDVGEIGR
ncbi:lysozyme [Variovorax sp. LARHSF232]